MRRSYPHDTGLLFQAGSKCDAEHYSPLMDDIRQHRTHCVATLRYEIQHGKHYTASLAESWTNPRLLDGSKPLIDP